MNLRIIKLLILPIALSFGLNAQEKINKLTKNTITISPDSSSKRGECPNCKNVIITLSQKQPVGSPYTSKLKWSAILDENKEVEFGFAERLPQILIHPAPPPAYQAHIIFPQFLHTGGLAKTIRIQAIGPKCLHPTNIDCVELVVQKEAEFKLQDILDL